MYLYLFQARETKWVRLFRASPDLYILPPFNGPRRRKSIVGHEVYVGLYKQMCSHESHVTILDGDFQVLSFPSSNLDQSIYIQQPIHL